MSVEIDIASRAHYWVHLLKRNQIALSLNHAGKKNTWEIWAQLLTTLQTRRVRYLLVVDFMQRTTTTTMTMTVDTENETTPKASRRSTREKKQTEPFLVGENPSQYYLCGRTATFHIPLIPSYHLLNCVHFKKFLIFLIFYNFINCFYSRFF